MSEHAYHRATSGSPEMREREMFYLTTHSTHFIYGYMASDIWLRTILIVRKETRCRHIGYSYRLTARVLLYAPSHRQDWNENANGMFVFLRVACRSLESSWRACWSGVSRNRAALTRNPCALSPATKWVVSPAPLFCDIRKSVFH